MKRWEWANHPKGWDAKLEGLIRLDSSKLVSSKHTES